MSRSQRKTPMIAVASIGSEKQDKKSWHRLWRRKEKAALKSASPDQLESHQTLKEDDVSDRWNMAKDGKLYWPLPDQTAQAEGIATFLSANPVEKASLKSRFLKRLMAK